MDCSYGFRIVGSPCERRRLVDAGAALRAYAACDGNADVGSEAYLSAFCYGEDFCQRADDTTGTVDVKGFTGPCWAAWVWFDIDREDHLDAALTDTRRLVQFTLARYSVLDDGDLLAFYSGSKGFHLGLPTCLWRPSPSADFNRIARRFAERIAEQAGVAIDVGVYDKVRAFRSPNSRHAKTGRYKRRLMHDELMGLSIDRIMQLAEQPEPFDVPAPTAASDQAAADWLDAERRVAAQAEATAKRRSDGNGTPTLNRRTLDFIRVGADQGDRHRILFSCAKNLAEFDCPPALAHALLTEAGRDIGLTPSDVRRQIDCGLVHDKEGGNG